MWIFDVINAQRKISELRREFDELKRTVNGLELEWSDMHDRLRRQLMKMSKRQEREELAADNGLENNPDQMELPLSGSGTTLTGRALLIQQQILQRRAARRQ